MIDEKTRANRLRRHMKLKVLQEALLELAVSDQDKKHLKARIVEIDRDIVATKGDSVEEGDAPLIPAAVENIEVEKAILPAITETAEEDAKKAEEHIVEPIKPKMAEPARKLNKVKKVGNPF